MDRIKDIVFDRNDLIGKGTFADVFRGNSGNYVFAVKCINKAEATRLLYLEDKPEAAMDMIMTEVKAMAAVRRMKSQNILKMIHHEDRKEELVIVLEFCSGGSLFDLIMDQGTVDEQHLHHILSSIRSAVIVFQDLKLVHKDLKLENIMLSHPATPQTIDRVQLKVTDFGLAVFLGDNDSLTGDAYGTPSYMAPEVFLQRQYDQQADLWSIGSMAYVCLTGFFPFKAQVVDLDLEDNTKNWNLLEKFFKTNLKSPL